VKLSVIIVNYNVIHFLEQCLRTVELAIDKQNTNVWVVDNNSVDGSCNMVKEKFPWVNLIENKHNPGFSIANNQAIKKSNSEYVLLLNPDTVVEEDTFSKIINFMDSHPEAGGLGVKMIDGKGNFLPESKRGLPTPSVAFYKIFGLSKIFPKSKKFNQYHLGHLDKNKTHEVEILSGAFMMIRRETLNKVGLLDETFFMYGEDIDLSYRIIKGGYKNYYFADTTIIHYKGESTKKGSLNYVKVFYNAMVIFAQKHFSSTNAKFYSFFINTAIYIRAGLSIAFQILKKTFLPITDALILFLCFYFIAPLWENIKYPEGGNFPPEYFMYAVPSYILIWIISIWIFGGYEKPFRILKQLKGFLWGTAILLIFYSLLPETMRYSRAMLVFGTLSGVFGLNIIRSILHLLNISDNKYYLGKKKRIGIIGTIPEAQRIINILEITASNIDIPGIICPDNNNNNGYIGNISQIEEIIRINKIEELIFCSENIQSQTIIQIMLQLGGQNINYKIASPDSLAIIGSNSIDTAGELYTIDINNISKSENKRLKRLLDVCFSISFLSFLPLTILFVKQKVGFVKNIFSVLTGYKSWVGYYNADNGLIQNLPSLRKGVLSLSLAKNTTKEKPELCEKMNIIYAQNYKLSTDIDIITKAFRYLGNQS